MTKLKASSAEKPRKGARTRNPEESRRALVDAAARIFNTVGYHGTDTNRIARAAGYTPGSFYTHFRDKKSIFLEVYRRWVEEEFAVISAVLASAPVGTRRRRLAKDILEHHRKWRVFRASLSALYAIDEEVRSVRLAERDRQIDGMIRNAREAGRIPPGRAAALASLLAGEALCDAIASGDARALGIGEDAMLDIFQRALRLESAGRD
jgi:AcrR family transcriptional regulator